MRQDKLFKRWRKNNGKQEQQEGRYTFNKVSGRLTRFWRRQRASQSREQGDCSTQQCASPLEYGLF